MHRRRFLATAATLGLTLLRPSDAASTPPLSLPLFDGGALDLPSFQDRVAVIRFLASW